MEVKDTTADNLNYTPPATNIYVVDPLVHNNNDNNSTERRRSGKETMFAFVAFMILVAGILMLTLANTSMNDCISDCRHMYFPSIEERRCETSCAHLRRNQRISGIVLLVVGAASLLADAAFVVWTYRLGGNYMGQ